MLVSWQNDLYFQTPLFKQGYIYKIIKKISKNMKKVGRKRNKRIKITFVPQK
jgi:hypothetical protein